MTTPMNSYFVRFFSPFCCRETAPNSGVFVRHWTKSTITVDCNEYTSKIEMKP